MKLIESEVSVKDQGGFVKILLEEPEDLWPLYNILANGDLVRASTVRKIVKDTASGPAKAERKRVTLTIKVVTIDYSPEGATLRLKGRVAEQNSAVATGTYHTLELVARNTLVLTKDYWDSIHLETIRAACDFTKRADLAAVVMQEGLAHLCLVTPAMTVVKAKIEMAIPRKRRGSTSQHDRAVLRFYEAVLQAVLEKVDFDVVKCLLLGGPGFVKDEFYKYMFEQAAKRDLKVVFANKFKMLRCHATSGYKHALTEILADKTLQKQLSETKAAAEVAALSRFFKMLEHSPERAYYSYKHVSKAQDMGAVDELLVTDRLFRSCDLAQRKLCVQLVEDVKAGGGRVHIFSTQHVCGKQLQQISGVAAILRFPLDLESSASSSSEEEDDDE